MTDPISDLLTRIRNANQTLLPEVHMPHSRMKAGIARLLKQEGYIADFAEEGQPRKILKIKLKYQGRKGVIESLRRISTPGLRRYVRATDIPRVLGGMGTVILSTSKGLMTGAEARRQKVGGELLCSIW